MKITSSPLAVDVVTNGRDCMRKELPKADTHTLSWYQKVPGGTWEHKVRPLSQEEAETMRAAFADLIKYGTEQTPDAVYDVLGIERETRVDIIQLTLTHGLPPNPRRSKAGDK